MPLMVKGRRFARHLVNLCDLFRIPLRNDSVLVSPSAFGGLITIIMGIFLFLWFFAELSIFIFPTYKNVPSFIPLPTSSGNFMEGIIDFPNLSCDNVKGIMLDSTTLKEISDTEYEISIFKYTIYQGMRHSYYTDPRMGRHPTNTMEEIRNGGCSLEVRTRLPATPSIILFTDLKGYHAIQPHIQSKLTVSKIYESERLEREAMGYQLGHPLPPQYFSHTIHNLTFGDHYLLMFPRGLTKSQLNGLAGKSVLHDPTSFCQHHYYIHVVPVRIVPNSQSVAKLGTKVVGYERIYEEEFQRFYQIEQHSYPPRSGCLYTTSESHHCPAMPFPFRGVIFNLHPSSAQVIHVSQRESLSHFILRLFAALSGMYYIFLFFLEPPIKKSIARLLNVNLDDSVSINRGYS